MIAGLVVGAGLAFGPAYGGTRYLVALGLGALAGLLAALVPTLLRWPGWTTVPAAAVLYLLFGAAAAVPSSAVGGVLPSLESVRLLALGVVTSWKQMLTVAVPVGSSGALLVPAYLSALVCAAVGCLIAVRARHALWALVAPVAMAAAAAALGADAGRPAGAGRHRARARRAGLGGLAATPGRVAWTRRPPAARAGAGADPGAGRRHPARSRPDGRRPAADRASHGGPAVRPADPAQPAVGVPVVRQGRPGHRAVHRRRSARRRPDPVGGDGRLQRHDLRHHARHRRVQPGGQPDRRRSRGHADGAGCPGARLRGGLAAGHRVPGRHRVRRTHEPQPSPKRSGTTRTAAPEW